MKISCDPVKNEKNIADRGLSFERAVDFDFSTGKNLARHAQALPGGAFRGDGVS